MAVPKFSSQEEYQQWKAERLANPQPVSPLQPPAHHERSDDSDPDLEVPTKQIRQAWIAGIISGVVTLLVTVIAASGHDILGLGYSLFNFLDVALIFALTFGLYMKSRTCALLMLLYFVGSKIFIWLQLGKLSGLPGAIIFGYYFLMGIIGTFDYRRIKARDGNSAAWRPITITAAIVMMIAVLFFGKNLGLSFDANSLIPAPTAAEWKEFKSPEGGFFITMPGEPERSKQTVKTAAGDMDMYIYMLESRSGAYGVIYSEFPSLYLQQPNAAERLLDGGHDGAVAQMKGKLLDEKSITIGRHPGRELHIECAQGTIVMRIFLINTRLYQVMAVLPKGQAISDDTMKFLESFRAET